ncbi:transposase [Actinoalloteichus caeruleus]|uniref:transposase n=1 Tax=Actinoalloteichus cyanogriseus TaxID=2893586 RepID=UPI003559182E
MLPRLGTPCVCSPPGSTGLARRSPTSTRRPPLSWPATTPPCSTPTESGLTRPRPSSSRPATTPNACEASFAALCGVSPVEASSGRTQRHRLNRGGDRQANSAPRSIVLVRLRWDRRTRDYIDRRVREGKTKREAVRCLKRYIARELYRIITSPEPPAAPARHAA